METVVVDAAFIYAESDMPAEIVTINAGTLQFLPEGVIEMYMDQTVYQDGQPPMTIATTAVGPYVQNGNEITYTFTGIRVGGIYQPYPDIVADAYKNLKGQLSVT